MSKRALKAAGGRVGRRAAAMLCGVLLLGLPGVVAAQGSTELAGAGGGAFPANTTYNGVVLSGMRFGFGVDLAATGGVAGTFEFTLLGLSGAGLPQVITIEGTATGGTGTVGSGATVLGTTRVDMGDGSPPTAGLPFMLAITTDTSGQGTLEMVVDATTLPVATITSGSVAVAPCKPDLPTLITDSLCPTGDGTIPGIGHNWISIPSHTNLKTAKDLCAAVGPTAVSVGQKFPDTATPGSTVAGTWTYDCASHVCTPGLATSPPSEAACAADCFCIDPGEGYDVVVSAPTSFQVKGCESQVPIVLAPGTQAYLISVPINTNLHTLQDLAVAIGMPPAGGTVSSLNACTGSFISCTAGTIGCSSVPLTPGRAYRVRYTGSTGATFINPTNSTAQCPPPC